MAVTKYSVIGGITNRKAAWVLANVKKWNVDVPDDPRQFVLWLNGIEKLGEIPKSLSRLMATGVEL